MDLELGEGHLPTDAGDAETSRVATSSADEIEATTTSTSALSPSEISAITLAANKATAPAPPQWRFVNQARKSTGYSSLSAGVIVRGKSSQELGAKYVAPKVTYSEKNAEKNGDVGELSTPDLKYSEFDKEQEDVGELISPDIKYSVFDKEKQTVGKLQIDDPDPEDVECIEGGIVISHNPKDGAQPSKSPREWINYHLRTKDAKPTGKSDIDKFSNLLEEENTPERLYKGVGKLQFRDDDLGESFNGEIPRRKLEKVVNSENGTAVRPLIKESPADSSMDLSATVDMSMSMDSQSPRGDDKSVSELNAVDEFEVYAKPSGMSTDDSSTDDTKRRRRIYLLLFLVPLLIAVALAGAILGKKKSSAADEDSIRAIAVIAIPPNITVQPSTLPNAYPSASAGSPSTFFQGQTAVLSNITTVHPSAFPSATTHSDTHGLFDDPSTSSPTTYIPTSFPTRVPSVKPSQPPTSSPSNRPIVSVGGCPEAFVPVSYYGIGTQVQLGGIVYECISYSCGTYGYEPGSSSGVWKEGWEVVGSCSGTITSVTSAPTSLPITSAPTPLPTREPSEKPSQLPTSSPSKRPVTLSPTKQPTPFLGGCPEAFVPVSYYLIGTQVQLEGVVYECISYSCGTYGYEPGSSSGVWKEGWEVVGSCSGTIASVTSVPTPLPTREPSVKPSSFPSRKPSQQPTYSPSRKPSQQPTYSPSRRPVTLPPTNQPIAFIGGCPESFSPYSFYLIGAQVQVEGVIYECISSSCGTDGDASPNEGWEVLGLCSGTITSSPTRRPSMQPSQMPTKYPSRAPSQKPTTSPSRGPSKRPTRTPSKAPSTEPTVSPTYEPSYSPTLEPTFEPSPKPSKQPSRQPTPLPTNEPQPTEWPTDFPTLKPTCAENGDFNLCIAIDMSGSVCNADTNSLCTECRPQEICNWGKNIPNLSICCSNFDNMLEFTRNLVTSLGELDTNQDFSIVHFGTEVAIASTLESSRQSVKTINTLRYSGGKTNLVGAIDSCQQTLAASPPDRKNLMLIITDGAPSVPEVDAEGAAANAATNAKNQDTFIIPVLIEEGTAQSPVAFLRDSISSDGNVFVADFDGLANIENSLFEQVTCQARKGQQEGRE